MKGDLIEVGDRLGEIARVIYTQLNRIATVIFFGEDRIKVDLNDYVWDKEKKVWKK